MRSSVVYYSFGGNTRFIAESIAEAVGADLLEIKPKKELSSKGFMKYLWGGRQVVMGEKPGPSLKRSQSAPLQGADDGVIGFRRIAACVAQKSCGFLARATAVSRARAAGWDSKEPRSWRLHSRAKLGCVSEARASAT